MTTQKNMQTAVASPTHFLVTDGIANESTLGYSTIGQVQTALDIPAGVGAAVAALQTPPVGSGLATTGTVNLDMATLNATYQTITMTGNITFTTSNRAAGRSVTIRLIEAAGITRTLNFPANWVFVGAEKPSGLNTQTAILTVTFFGTADADAVAAAAVQA
jgi:hypothetical protein